MVHFTASSFAILVKKNHKNQIILDDHKNGINNVFDTVLEECIELKNRHLTHTKLSKNFLLLRNLGVKGGITIFTLTKNCNFLRPKTSRQEWGQSKTMYTIIVSMYIG